MGWEPTIIFHLELIELVILKLFDVNECGTYSHWNYYAVVCKNEFILQVGIWDSLAPLGGCPIDWINLLKFIILRSFGLRKCSTYVLCRVYVPINLDWFWSTFDQMEFDHSS